MSPLGKEGEGLKALYPEGWDSKKTRDSTKPQRGTCENTRSVAREYQSQCRLEMGSLLRPTPSSVPQSGALFHELVEQGSCEH